MHHISALKYLIEVCREGANEHQQTADQDKAYNTLKDVDPCAEVTIEELFSKSIGFILDNAHLMDIHRQGALGCHGIDLDGGGGLDHGGCRDFYIVGLLRFYLRSAETSVYIIHHGPKSSIGA